MGWQQATSLPLCVAAEIDPTAPSERPAGRFSFNGKVERPTVFDRAVPAADLAALAHRPSAAVDELRPCASWDLGWGSPCDRIPETTGHAGSGRLVNMPTRLVTDHTWAREQGSFPSPAAGYAAIHFHDDDVADAGWEMSFEFDVPHSWRSGVYAAELHAGTASATIPFFVHAEGATGVARTLVLLPTFTYQAYANDHASTRRDLSRYTDDYGPLPPEDTFLARHPEYGLSLYDRHSDGSGSCYSSRKRPVLNLRPDYKSALTRSLRHLGADLFLVDWLERMGFDYEVTTDEELHRRGVELLASFDVVIVPSHSEYWSAPMMDALERYLDGSGKLMYLGGNGFYWVTAASPDHPGVIEVRRGASATAPWQSAPGEGYCSTTGEVGGLWRDRGRAPQMLAGVGFTSQGWGRARGYRRQPDSFDPRVAFVFDGVDDDEEIGAFGLMMGGAAGDEMDRLDFGQGTPRHALLLATADGHDEYFQPLPDDIDQRTVRTRPKDDWSDVVRADMVWFDTPSGGAVFSVGSINWCGSLSYNDYDNNVSTITGNVLRHFLGLPPHSGPR